jgi:hypothetical protein
MTGTTITIKGADEAHYLAATALTSRLVMFPDGIARHITLQNRQWEIADRLQKERGWPEDGLPGLAFDQAKKFCTDPARFEDELRDSFELFIRLSSGRSLGYHWSSPVDNDNQPASQSSE